MWTNERQHLEDEKAENRHFRIGPLSQYARVLYSHFPRTVMLSPRTPVHAPCQYCQYLVGNIYLSITISSLLLCERPDVPSHINTMKFLHVRQLTALQRQDG